MSGITDYKRWISANVEGNGYAKCVEATEAMALAFSELVIEKGYFHCPVIGDRPHCWLRAPDGTIVDPTAKQHPTGAWFPADDQLYEALTEEEFIRREPVGKCANCGEPIFLDSEAPSPDICSSDCYSSYAAYLNGGGL